MLNKGDYIYIYYLLGEILMKYRHLIGLFVPCDLPIFFDITGKDKEIFLGSMMLV